MYVDLRCTKCGDYARVSFAQLYDIWLEGYNSMAETRRPEAKAVTDIKCHCGHYERYDGPMFQYIFQLIFDEFIQKKEV
jgi:hypothetical protein